MINFFLSLILKENLILLSVKGLLHKMILHYKAFTESDILWKFPAAKLLEGRNFSLCKITDIFVKIHTFLQSKTNFCENTVNFLHSE